AVTGERGGRLRLAVLLPRPRARPPGTRPRVRRRRQADRAVRPEEGAGGVVPGHWAPDGLTFYAGTQFPERYRGGAFVAFHGSWNRAPLPQAGYRVAFVPFKNGKPAGGYETFADGFWKEDAAGPKHRPVGVAVGPDG